MCLPLVLVFVLVAPALLLAGAVEGLARSGPAGVLAAGLLVVAALVALAWAVVGTRRCLRRLADRV